MISLAGWVLTRPRMKSSRYLTDMEFKWYQKSRTNLNVSEVGVEMWLPSEVMLNSDLALWHGWKRILTWTFRKSHSHENPNWCQSYDQCCKLSLKGISSKQWLHWWIIMLRVTRWKIWYRKLRSWWWMPLTQVPMALKNHHTRTCGDGSEA